MSKETAEQRMLLVRQALDHFEARLGLPAFDPSFKYNMEIALIFNDQWKTSISLERARYILALFGLHLQRALNYETSRLTWAKSELKKQVTPRLANYRGTGSFDQIFNAAALDDEYSRKLVDICDFAQQRMDRLSGLQSCISNLRQALEGFHPSDPEDIKN